MLLSVLRSWSNGMRRPKRRPQPPTTKGWKFALTVNLQTNFSFVLWILCIGIRGGNFVLGVGANYHPFRKRWLQFGESLTLEAAMEGRGGFFIGLLILIVLVWIEIDMMRIAVDIRVIRQTTTNSSITQGVSTPTLPKR